MTNRGEIRNKTLSTKIKTWGSLRFGNITPTDIDCFMEFDNKLFIIVEGKHDGAEVPRGQYLALVRMCKAISDSGKNCMLIIADNFITDDGMIDTGKSKVREIFWNGNKKEIKKINNVRQAIDIALEKSLNRH